jgi:hypothetical protein
MKNTQKKRDTNKFRKSLKNKQMKNQKTHRLPVINTDTIYSIFLTGIYEGVGLGFNLPQFKEEYDINLTKGKVWESLVLLDLVNKGKISSSILSIVHSGIPKGDTIQDLIMRSLGLSMIYTPLPFLDENTKITIGLVKSCEIGVNIYSEMENYIEYVKCTHLDLVGSFLKMSKNVG